MPKEKNACADVELRFAKAQSESEPCGGGRRRNHARPMTLEKRFEFFQLEKMSRSDRLITYEWGAGIRERARRVQGTLCHRLLIFLSRFSVTEGFFVLTACFLGIREGSASALKVTDKAYIRKSDGKTILFLTRHPVSVHL